VNNLQGIYTIWYRDLLRFRRDRMRLVMSLAFPLLFLIVFGSGLGGSMGLLAPGVNFSKFMFPGIIGMTVLLTSFMSGVSVVWDREFGFLKEILVAPLGRSGIVLGKALGSATVAVMQGIVMLVLAPILGVTLTPMLIVKLVPLLIVLSVSLSGLGILVASRMRSQQGFQIIVQIIIFPLIFLSGVFFPVNNVPTWLEAISKINPLTYGVDAIRQLFLGGEIAAISGGNGSYVIGVTVLGHTMTIFEDVLIVSIFGAGMLLIAAWSFKKQE